MRAPTIAGLLSLAALALAGLCTPAPARAASPPCSGAPHPARYDHVVVIAFENKARDEVLGGAGRRYAPYIGSLADHCAKHMRYAGLSALPSLPQYLQATSGTHAGITDNCEPGPGCLVGVRSIFSQVRWRAYEENMPAPCALRGGNNYAPRHNPPVYYTTISRAACVANDLPLRGAPSLGATLTWITPNLCHDMHSSCATPTPHFANGCLHLTGHAKENCRIESGDQWLAHWLPANVLNTRTYRAGHTVVFLWWDEGVGRTPDFIPLVAISPSISRGTVAAPPALRTHDDFLWTLQTLAGRSCLNGSCGQTSMLRELGLR